MSSLQKIQDGFFEHIGTTVAVIIFGLLGWIFVQAAPIVLPVVERFFPVRILLAILALSITLNIVLGVAIYRLASNRQKLRLLYGILWDKDKNPHCPVCKNPGVQYDNWNYQWGYHCRNCKQTFALVDSSGVDVKPEVAIAQL